MKKTLLITTLVSSLFSSDIVIQDENKDKNLNITVYNNGLAMINEKREFNLEDIIKNEKQRIIYQGFPAYAIMESIIPQFSDNIQLLSQNYQYDIISLNKLLEKSIGKKTKFVERKGPTEITNKVGILLSLNPILLQLENGTIISGLNPQDAVFEELPSDLIIKPSLIWNTFLTENIKKKKANIELTYLTNGVSWNSDYVLKLINDNVFNLKGWITITNNSGTEYDNANIFCLAGDVNRVKEENFNNNVMRKQKEMMFSGLAADSMEVKEESINGFHLYKIPFKEKLSNNEKKQINFISSENIPYTQVAKFSTVFSYNFNKRKVDFDNIVRFENKKEYNIGIPLPEGVMRLYGKDKEENIHFIGENKINNTPINELVEINIGKFFDIKAEEVIEKFSIGKLNYNVETNTLFTNEDVKERKIEYYVQKPFDNNYNNETINSNCLNNKICNFKSISDSLYLFEIKLKKSENFKLNINFNGTKN